MMKKIQFGIILVSTLSLFSGGHATSNSQGWQLNLAQSTGSVRFLAVGRPSFLKIRGEGPAPEGNMFIRGNSVTGIVSFNLASLGTGIKMRDEHMKQKYLEVQKFPKAELKITKIDLPASLWTSQDAAFEDITYEGTLSLHGVQKVVSGLAKIERHENVLNVGSQFKIKLKDFNVEIPSFKGITVSEDVDVSVSFSAPFENKK